MKTTLILSGPTREFLDPVRYLSNASSGKMGRALAEEALRRGFHVEFITGPVAAVGLPNPHPKLTVHPIVSALEMLTVSEPLFEQAQLILFAAAVADYRPANRQTEKLPKTDGPLILELQPNPDLAATLCARKKPGQTAIGFALQTHNGPERARAKLLRKQLDAIVLNTPASLEAEEGSFSLLTQTGSEFEDWGRISKTECARRIFFAAEQLAEPDSA